MFGKWNPLRGPIGQTIDSKPELDTLQQHIPAGGLPMNSVNVPFGTNSGAANQLPNGLGGLTATQAQQYNALNQISNQQWVANANNSGGYITYINTPTVPWGQSGLGQQGIMATPWQGNTMTLNPLGSPNYLITVIPPPDRSEFSEDEIEQAERLMESL